MMMTRSLVLLRGYRPSLKINMKLALLKSESSARCFPSDDKQQSDDVEMRRNFLGST